MTNPATADLRNVVLIGGPRTGKTSFVERALLAGSVIQRAGTVNDGTTASDFTAEEKDKKHSVYLSLLRVPHQGRLLNLLDAPGYPDHVGEAAAGLAACESAALFVDAGKGVTFPARKVWELATAAGRARCVVVTHLDEAEVDWPAWLAGLSEALGARCVPLSLPQGTGKAFQGVSAVPLAGEAAGPLAAARDALVEAIVEVDEAAMTRFLESDWRPDADEAARLLTRSMLAGTVVPVLCLQALDGRGLEPLLDFMARCLPSPADGPFFRDEQGQPVEPGAAGTSALCFRTVIDPFVGRLSVLRVVSGHLDHGHSLVVARTGKPEKLAHLQVTQGKDHKEVHSAVAGDIVAVTKVEVIETSDTLHDAAHPRRFPRLAVPKPMVARAIELLNHADEVKLSTALKRVAAEDPTFTYERDEATGQLVVHGLSMMHLESVLARVKERGHLDLKVEVPRVPLRETITGRAEGHYRHKKQTGGRGQFAEVFLRVEPAARGAGLVYVDDTVGGSVPRQFIPAIEKGVKDAMPKGIIAGYPVVDVTVRVYDGKFHDVDSDEASFKIAGSRAFRDAFHKARPVILEPLLDIEVATPSRFMGAVTSDINTRRGHITGMDSLGDTQVVKVRVPQREVLTYPTALRSLTSGEGSYTAAFHDYEVVPPNVQAEIMAGFKGHHEEE
ncbi:MAG: elongation factor G [Planctomycetes bacterium]|nr:elongation factor G [Planctomycetota bacterium]